MTNCDEFSSFHPVIGFLYFTMVLVCSMCFMNPVCLAISLVSALAYCGYLKGRKGLWFSLRLVLPMMVLAAFMNPAFNHEGATIMAYLPSGNPLTLESMVYGAAAAAMLASVLLWFTCFNQVMPSDKFVYLFGRLIPSLSLVLSMTLRFIPRFRFQMGVVAAAQRCVDIDESSGTLIQKVKRGVSVFSVMVTWSLENAIETADSMRSRGYGLSGRTAFSIYTFVDRDKTALAWLLLCSFYIISGWVSGGYDFRYYPTMKGLSLSPFSISFYLTYGCLCLTPLFIDKKEDLTWKRLRSEI